MKTRTRTTPFQLESLESRRLLNALTVSNAADSGVGSLRAQIAAAQSGDTITFAAALAGQTIRLTSGEIAIAKSLSIDGPGADQLNISGNSQSRIFSIGGSTHQVVIRDLTLWNGFNDSGGGGGAILNGATLTVTNCTLSGNTATARGGAVYNTGTLAISGSTIVANTAYNPTHLAFGGGIASDGPVSLSNCTIVSNSVRGGVLMTENGEEGASGVGGGLYVSVWGSMSVRHCTFAGNAASSAFSGGAGYGGGIYGGQMNLFDVIVADNYADEGRDLSSYYESIGSLGHNLIGSSSGASGYAASDLLDVNPQLGPLQNNGGPTHTMALLAGSPAINAGDNASAPATDQRGAGFPRIVGGTIDIGAFESGIVAGKTFVGPGGAGSGGDWANANNWSPAGVPAATDNVSVAGKSVNLGSSAIVASLTLTGGATLSVGANGSRVLRTSTLTITGTGSTLNLNDNDLIIDYSGAGGVGASPFGAWNGASYTGVTGMVARGYTHGDWTGDGLVTTTAQARTGVATIAVAEAAQLFELTGTQTAVFSGQTVDATAVLVKYTYTGDVNFDGVVDGADYGVIDNWVQFPGTTGYSNGDFNYDGVIDGADYGLIDNAIQLQGGPL